MKRFFIFILLSLFFSMYFGCSPEYHIKRAAHHYDKEIKKGYNPINDTIKAQAELAIKYNTDYLKHLKPRILIKLDSFDISNQDKEKVAEIVYKEVQIASKQLESDTSIDIHNKEGKKIGKINAELKEGIIKISYVIEYPEPIFYTQSFFESLGIKKWQLYLIIAICSILVLLYFINKLR